MPDGRAPPATESGKFPMPIEAASEVTFPLAWPPYALAVKQGRPIRVELFNLLSGVSLGSVQSTEMLPPSLAISPDGTRMAGRVLKGGPAHIRVWSFKSGGLDGEHILSGEDESRGPVTHVQFASPERLLALRTGSPGAHVTVIEKGQPHRTFSMATKSQHATLLGQAVGTSPGGRYLLAILGTSLVAHDVGTGECVGSIDLPADVDSFAQCAELVFSPDGRRVATMLMPQDRQSIRLLEFDFSSGKVAQNVSLNSKDWQPALSEYVPQQDSHPLACLPDGGGYILFGRLFWKPGMTKPEPAFAEAKDNKPRSLLNADAVVAVVRDEKGGQTLEALRRSGATLAGTTPPPKPTGSTSAAAWNSAVDPAPLSPQFSNKTIACFGLVPQAPRFPQRPGRHAAAAIGGEYVVFDLEAGQETKRFKATASPLAIFDVSPDGRYLLVGGSPNSGEKWKIEAWNIATGKLAWSREETAGVDENTIEFTGPAQLLLATGEQDTRRRRYSVWNIDTQQLVREFKSPEGLGTYHAGSHLVTPGGRYTIGVNENSLLVHDIKSGSLVGKATLPLATGRVLPQEVGAAAVTLDGKSLHLLVRYHDDTARAFRCDMATGQLAEQAVDAKQLTAAAGARAYIRQTPWLLPEGTWLSYRQAVVNVQNGRIIGPLGVAEDAALVSLTGDRLALAQIQRDLAESPAIVVTSLPIASSATSKLAARVEALRPKVVASVTPKTSEPAKPPPTRPVPTRPGDNTAEASPRKKWSSVVDPPKKAEPFVPAKQFAVTLGRNAKVVPSERGGPFAVVVDEDKESAQVLSLTSGKPVGEPFPIAKGAEAADIDPSGKYVAFQGNENAVVVHSVESGRSMTLKEKDFFVGCHYLGFADGDRLVAAFSVDNRVQIKIWRAEDGKLVAEWTLSDLRDDWAVRDTGLAISPGGRYLAALRYEGLEVYDLNDPSKPQSAVLPFSNKRSQTQNTFMKCEGIRFSPDGKRLAAQYGQLQQSYVTIWDLESGEPVVYRPSASRLTLRTITHSSLSPPLAWVPSGESLVLEGTIMVDSLTARPYWVLTQEELTSVFPLTGSAMLVVDRSNERRLMSAPLSKQLFDGLKAVRSSPVETPPPLKPIDAKVPPLLDAAVAKAAPLSPDGVSKPGESQSIRLEGENLDFSPARMSVGGGVLALERNIFNYGPSHRVITAGPLPPERTVVLETYDQASGKRLQRLDVPERAHLLDISPDGSLLLTGDTLYGSGGYNRLDIWAPKLGRHAAGWQATPPDSDYSDVPTWAGFVDKKNVLVLSKAGLVLWQLPECRQVYSVSMRGRPEFSPGRKYFVDATNYVVRDSLTGQALLKLEGFSTDRWQGLLAASFTSDGSAIVGVASGGMSHSVVRWNLADGKVAKDFAIPPVQFDRLALLGDRGLLLLTQRDLASHGQILVDLEQQQVASSLKAGGVHASSSDARYWRSDSIIAGRKPDYFVQSFGPQDFVWPTLDPVPSYAVVGPGSKVAVQVQSNLPEAAKLKAMFEEAVQKAGFTIDAASPVRAVLEANQQATVVRKGPPRDILVNIVVCRISIVDRSGQVAWQVADQRPRERPEDFDAVAWLKPRSLPKRLFHPDWEMQITKGELPKVSDDRK